MKILRIDIPTDDHVEVAAVLFEIAHWIVIGKTDSQGKLKNGQYYSAIWEEHGNSI